ncbi:DoxX family protein [Glaciecola sp. 1036]|uniref:DoxX family protein n=1 Tax=Alteromonadaceae TaxID=72275 RepID=UPI003CFC75B0
MQDKVLTIRNLFFLLLIFILAVAQTGNFHFSFNVIEAYRETFNDYLDLYQARASGLALGILLTVFIVVAFKNNRIRFIAAGLLLFFELLIVTNTLGFYDVLFEFSGNLLIGLTYATKVAIIALATSLFLHLNAKHSPKHLLVIVFVSLIVNEYSGYVYYAVFDIATVTEQDFGAIILIALTLVFFALFLLPPSEKTTKPPSTSIFRLWHLYALYSLVIAIIFLSYYGGGNRELNSSTPQIARFLSIVYVVFVMAWIGKLDTNQSLARAKKILLVTPILLVLISLLFNLPIFSGLNRNGLQIMGWLLIPLHTASYLLFFGLATYIVVVNLDSVKRLAVVLAISSSLYSLFDLMLSPFDDLISSGGAFSLLIFCGFILFTLLTRVRGKVEDWLENSESDYEHYEDEYSYLDEAPSHKSKLNIRHTLWVISSTSLFFLRLGIVVSFVFILEVGRTLSFFQNSAMCDVSMVTVSVAAIELIACFFLLLGRFTRLAAGVLVITCLLQALVIDGLYSQGFDLLEKDFDTLMIFAFANVLLIIFGAGKFSLDKFKTADWIGSYKLIITIVFSILFWLYNSILANHESGFQENMGYSSVVQGKSQLSVRSYQIIVATEELLDNTLRTAISAYYNNDFYIEDDETELGFLNEFIKEYYPDSTYRVIETDFWDNKFIFHWLTNESYELRSAGPDGVMHNQDDIRWVCAKECKSETEFSPSIAMSWLRHGEIFNDPVDQLQFNVWHQNYDYFGKTTPLPSDSSYLQCDNF